MSVTGSRIAGALGPPTSKQGVVSSAGGPEDEEAPAPTTKAIISLSGLDSVPSDPSADDLERLLRALGRATEGADGVTLAVVRHEAARRLMAAGVKNSAALVDAAIKSRAVAKPESAHAVKFEDAEPWPEPVRGDDLLRALVRVVRRYVACSPSQALAMALWILHAHTLDAWEISPLLCLSSPLKRCGKTTALTIIGSLVPRAMPVANISPSAIYRAIDALHPTLLLDEADTYVGLSERIRGLLNSGHTRAAAFVLLTSPTDQRPRRFSTFGAKVIALIGHLPGTLRDRSIVIRLHRLSPRENVDGALYLRGDPEPERLRRQAMRWAQDSAQALSHAFHPAMPAELNHRAVDNWMPLAAIAEAVGGEWPEQAQTAAVTVSGSSQDEQDEVHAVALLHDMRRLFRARGVDGIWSAEIVKALTAEEDRPWREFKGRSPVTVVEVARLLRPFGVGPKSIWSKGPEKKSSKGYDLAELEPMFERYLDPEPAEPAEPSSPNDLRPTGEPAVAGETGAVAGAP